MRKSQKEFQIDEATWEKMVSCVADACLKQKTPYRWPTKKNSIDCSKLGLEEIIKLEPQDEAGSIETFKNFSKNFPKKFQVANSFDKIKHSEKAAILNIFAWGGTYKPSKNEDKEHQKKNNNKIRNAVVAINNNLADIKQYEDCKNLSSEDIRNIACTMDDGVNVPTWSKILAAYRPGEFFIYDSRVAIALSYIAWKNDLVCVWRIPEPEFGTSKNAEAQKEKYKELKKNCQKTRNGTGLLTNGADIPTCYDLYLKLLKKVAEDKTIRDAYKDAGFSEDRAIMAHLEKMLFMIGGDIKSGNERKDN